MTTGPRYPARAGRDRLRARHADRERAIETLKDAFVHGRLTKDEFDARAGRALCAHTYADLAVLTADIPAADRPASPVSVAPVRRTAPVRRRPLARAAAGSGACLVIAFGAVLVGVMLAENSVGPGSQGSWIPCLFVAVAAVITAIGIFLNGVGTAVAQRWPGRQPPLPKQDATS